ncbi:flagellar hook-length control protein FliK [Alkalihalobacillus sp. LMS39]|uniref:flagellar hook-length control protein FliK n=1 Tax=Alkalihalobacillus sp. LMS39 TaxID=2924032 RepID=UPI001FB48821|nr:flagellar hook-length control protein FliK [Alkalihalobacillus sp. LMS39]UOE92836.1 flagellar hook-length control protein FliK [Alkalihalobacillus sp. LMS39]
MQLAPIQLLGLQQQAVGQKHLLSESTGENTAFFGVFQQMLLPQEEEQHHQLELQKDVPLLTETETDEALFIVADHFQHLYVPTESTKEATLVLEQLPDDIKQQLENVIGSNQSMELVLNDTELNPITKVIALLLSLQEEQDKGTIDVEEALAPLLPIVFELFPTVIQQSSKANETVMTGQPNVKELLQKVIAVLAEVNQVVQKEKPVAEAKKETFFHHIQLQQQMINQKQSVMPIPNLHVNYDDGTKSLSLIQQGLELAQPMDRVQQFVIHVGESETKQAQQQQFMRQFQELLGKSNVRLLNGGTTQLTLKLNPAHLGRLDIQLLQQNGVITAKIMATTTAAKELIESQLHQLRQSFGLQQLQVEKIEIVQQQQFGQLNKDEENKQQQQREQRHEEDKEEPQQESFSELLEDLTFNEKV